MLKGHEKISTSLLYFAEIGEIYVVNREDIQHIWRKLVPNKRGRKFNKELTGKYYIIWRTR
jgi:hypothetical protein